MEKKESKNKKEKQVIAKEGMKAISELEDSLKLEHMVKDNKIEFKVKEKTFRIRKPNLLEQQDLSTFNRKKYMDLVNDDSFLFKKQWIKKYKNKGIDIAKMETDIAGLQEEIKQLLLRLAQSAQPSVIKKT